MKTTWKKLTLVLALVVLLVFTAAPVLADEMPPQGTAQVQQADATGSKALAAGIAMGLAGGLGAIGMGIAIAKATEGVARQPEAEGKIRTTLILGIVFIETAIIYALIIAILIVFVL